VDNTHDVVESYPDNAIHSLDLPEQHGEEDDEEQDDDDGSDNDGNDEDDNEGHSAPIQTAEFGSNQNLDVGIAFTADQPQPPSNFGVPNSQQSLCVPTYASNLPLMSAILPDSDQQLPSGDLGLSPTLDSLSGSRFDETFSEAPFSPPFSLGLALSRRTSTFAAPQFPVSDEQTLDLVESYLSETATWCDTTDSMKHFSVLSAHDMLETMVFKAAALAVASRQLNKIGMLAEDITLRCYQYTIRLLIQQDPDQTNTYVLATCILLCVYEMMASDVVDWRRHLKVREATFSQTDDSDANARDRDAPACSQPKAGMARLKG
jgi:hypothetical protein